MNSIEAPVVPGTTPEMVPARAAGRAAGVPGRLPSRTIPAGHVNSAQSRIRIRDVVDEADVEQSWAACEPWAATNGRPDSAQPMAIRRVVPVPEVARGSGRRAIERSIRRTGGRPEGKRRRDHSTRDL